MTIVVLTAMKSQCCERILEVLQNSRLPDPPRDVMGASRVAGPHVLARVALESAYMTDEPAHDVGRLVGVMMCGRSGRLQDSPVRPDLQHWSLRCGTPVSVDRRSGIVLLRISMNYPSLRIGGDYHPGGTIAVQ